MIKAMNYDHHHDSKSNAKEENGKKV